MARVQRIRSRRQFLKGSAIAGAGATLAFRSGTSPAFAREMGSENRVRVGFIGVGNRGTRLLERFLRCDTVKVAALCDVYRPYLERNRSKVSPKLLAGLKDRVPPMIESFGAEVGRHKDFRELLDRKDIDAVVIATPDHWHAIQAIAACEAGKDVYVEKPLTITVVEGRKIVEAAKRTGRVVQVGLQRRSSSLYRRLAKVVQSGEIGRVSVARAYRISNMSPAGIGKAVDSEPPEGLDWDLWLGPRAWRPYRDTLAFYKFRWWSDYSSQVANWGVHYFDAIRLLLGEDAPVSVSAHGGRQGIDDDRTIPDTMEVTFEFASGRLLAFGQYEACGGTALQSGEVELRGTLGNLYASDVSYEIVPSVGGQFQDPAQRRTPETGEIEREDIAEAHIRNFLDCVQSRKPCNCGPEEGHRSTTFALLANIALATRSRIDWDPVQERITNHEAANRLLSYEYRAPWKL